MNIYDEALEKIGNTVLHHIDEIGNITTHKLSESNEYKLVKQALNEHEALKKDVARYFELFELLHSPTSNTNPNEIRPFIEWASELCELEKQILSKVGKEE